MRFYRTKGHFCLFFWSRVLSVSSHTSCSVGLRFEQNANISANYCSSKLQSAAEADDGNAISFAGIKGSNLIQFILRVPSSCRPHSTLGSCTFASITLCISSYCSSSVVSFFFFFLTSFADVFTGSDHLDCLIYRLYNTQYGVHFLSQDGGTCRPAGCPISGQASLSSRALAALVSISVLTGRTPDTNYIHSEEYRLNT